VRGAARVAGLAAALAWAALACGGVAPADAGLAEAERSAAAGHDGLWKAVVPPETMHGEFDSNDPVGVAAGKRIAADCSLNWVDPDAGQRYCFSSATSLVFFLEAPHAWLERARAQWRRLSDAAR